MKKSINKLLIALLMLNASNSIYAYRWVLNNFTSTFILAQIELHLSTNPYFVLIAPKASGDFDWSPGNTMAGFCLGRIKYLEPNQELYQFLYSQPSLINTSTMEVKDNRALLNFLDRLSDPAEAKKAGLSQPYVRKEANIALIADELYSKTSVEARRLGLGAKIVGFFANLVADSKCRGRDIMIVERGGKIEFCTYAN